MAILSAPPLPTAMRLVALAAGTQKRQLYVDYDRNDANRDRALDIINEQLTVNLILATAQP